MSPRHSARLQAGLFGVTLLLPLVAAFSATAAAEDGVGAAATNNPLTITPTSGATLTGNPSFSAPAPGCTGTANGASVTLSGTGVVPAGNPDGSLNIIGAAPFAPGSAISIGSNGQAWDGLMPSNLTRPLNGTFTVKIQCLEDGDMTGQAFFDRDVTFTGASNTWVAVGQGSATPTPTPGATPTPSPGATPTPTASIDATPTPTPDAEGCTTTNTCEDDAGTDDTDGGEDESGGNLPGTGGRSPTDIIVLSALLLLSGLMFLALAVEPRSLPADDPEGRL